MREGLIYPWFVSAEGHASGVVFGVSARIDKPVYIRQIAWNFESTHRGTNHILVLVGRTNRTDDGASPEGTSICNRYGGLKGLQTQQVNLLYFMDCRIFVPTGSYIRLISKSSNTLTGFVMMAIEEIPDEEEV